jgi:hypothetical protein
MNEEWCEVPGHADHLVSNLGRVRQRRVNGRVLTGYVDDDGYCRVRLDGRQHRVHRLVCEAFNGPQPDSCEVCHNDGNRLNNTAANLRWGSRSENMFDAVQHGTHFASRGSSHPKAKLTEQIAEEARLRYANGESGRALAREFGITSANMSRLLRGETWVRQDAPDLSNHTTTPADTTS